MKVKAMAASCIALLLITGCWSWRVQSRNEVKAAVKFDGMRREPPTVSLDQTIEYVNPDAEREFASLKPPSGWRERAARYEPYFHIAARKYRINPCILWTIAYHETGFRPEMISPKGARVDAVYAGDGTTLRAYKPSRSSGIH